MPVGILVDVGSVFVGGLAGAFMGRLLPEDLKDKLSMIFGICALSMGILSVVLMINMPAVIFAVIAGTCIGVLIRLQSLIEKGAGLLQKPFESLMAGSDADMGMLITVLVLFCASGTGIYGSIDSGMTGDHTILISKAILDFFTAMIFACSMGAVVAAIALPQLIIFMLLFLLAGTIYPLTTPDMINDFKACGGVLLLATSFNMMKLKSFPVADMIPAMALVMPISAFWTGVIAPML